MARIVETQIPASMPHADVVIIGGGAAGLIAALRALAAGASVLVIERDAVPQGSTALSAGLIPAAATKFQRAAGLADSHAGFVDDIMAKADGEPDRAAVTTVVTAVSTAIDWLAEQHDLQFSVISDFRYPGHTAFRMHGLPSRSGAELMDRLRSAAEAAGIDILCNARATALLVEPGDTSGRVSGVEFVRPDGTVDRIGCGAVVLACNGYGGNKALVAEHIPEIAGALYFGHPGNTGEAVLWGQALGARVRHLGGYQGHGSVLHPHGILLTWATITEGGFQVTLAGERFHNEAKGYSEAAAAVLRQPEQVAWTVFDQRIAGIARQFEDFRRAEALGAIVAAGTITELAAKTGLPVEQLTTTNLSVATAKADGRTDQFGRDWHNVPPLAADFCAARVTGALFHTQGGLVVDGSARVVRQNGTVLPNLFAAGGAACGVSGAQASGYLSGNGMLTAVAYGFLAGAEAARISGLHPSS
jgi:fumarate reductase flavoprotein subunit